MPRIKNPSQMKALKQAYLWARKGEGVLSETWFARANSFENITPGQLTYWSKLLEQGKARKAVRDGKA